MRAQAPGGCGVTVWGPPEGPQGKFWLDLGRDETAASRVNSRAGGVQVTASRGIRQRSLGGQVLRENATCKGPAMSEMPNRGAAPSRQEDRCPERPP